ncbi:MAG TPA: tetratricopeptide repeat protein, partial [Myxococcales bacterium]|nr:tetratricopeptide repeat protein [Myxococcales bacterium]
GEVLRSRGDWPAARAEHARALAALETRAGKGSPLLARPLVALAECERHLGRGPAARQALQRALEVMDPGDVALERAARRALELLPPG